jgi:steroid delta-isomerase-like uncharacterized protein
MGTTEQQTSAEAEFARSYGEAWAARDPERMASLCTEDVEWHDPALREPLHGRDGVRRFVTESFRMAPDFSVELLEAPYVSAAGPRVLQPYRMSGTMTGPWEFLGLAPTGRRFEIEGVDSWELRDGLMFRYNTFWDTTTLSRQIGVLPAYGSRAERTMTRLQHLQARLQRRAAR